MKGLNFPIKELRRAKDMRPDELPPVVGKGRIFEAFDELVAGLPKGEEEEVAERKAEDPKK